MTTENIFLKEENERLQSAFNNALKILGYLGDQENRSIKERCKSFKDGELYGEIKHWHIVNDENDVPKEHGEHLTVIKDVLDDYVCTDYLIYENTEPMKGWSTYDGEMITDKYKVLAWLDTDYPQEIKDLLTEN